MDSRNLQPEHSDARQGSSLTPEYANQVMGHQPQYGEGTMPANATTSHSSRDGSVTTAVEDNAAPHRVTSMEKIETAPMGDRHDSDDHNMGVTGTIKKVTNSAKRKIYLHHRNRKDLGKQFSPGSASQHVRSLAPDGSSVEKRHGDPEAQLDSEEDHRCPTVWQNIKIMIVTFPYWNMAFWSGWCYSIGSAMFIIAGAWSWAPLVWPETEFDGETKYGVPLWFFFGAILYQIGGVMAYLEAVNDGSFAGATMKRLLEGHQDIEKELLDAKLHTFFGHIVPHHHHEDQDVHGPDENEIFSNDSSEAAMGSKELDKTNTPESLFQQTKERIERRGGVDQGAPKEGEVRQYLTWRWWPTWHALRTYHIFELGYLACAIQLFGVTLYGVTAIVVLPGILDGLEWWQELGAYWVPQIVASCCFIIASVMFTIMGQDRWYKPKPGAVSWWIGIWALIGSVGFLLCSIFGIYGHHHTWAEAESSLSSMWGSFFYMLSGLFQWYEAINVNVGPVLAFPNNRTPVLLRHLSWTRKKKDEEKEEEKEEKKRMEEEDIVR